MRTREDAEAVADALRAVVGQAFDVGDAFEEGADEVEVVGGEFFDALLEDPLDAFGEAERCRWRCGCRARTCRA